jgi:hypothetical protein
MMDTAGLGLDDIRTKWLNDFATMKAAGGHIPQYGLGGKVGKMATGAADDLWAQIQRLYTKPAARFEVSTTKPPYLNRVGTPNVADRILADPVMRATREQLPEDLARRLGTADPIRGAWRNSEKKIERNPAFHIPFKGITPRVEGDPELMQTLAELGMLGDQDAVAAVRMLPRPVRTPKTNAAALQGLSDADMNTLVPLLDGMGVLADTPVRDVVMFPYSGKPDDLDAMLDVVKKTTPEVRVRLGRSDPEVDRTYLGKPGDRSGRSGPDYADYPSQGWWDPLELQRRVEAVRAAKEKAKPR